MAQSLTIPNKQGNVQDSNPLPVKLTDGTNNVDIIDQNGTGTVPVVNIDSNGDQVSLATEAKQDIINSTLEDDVSSQSKQDSIISGQASQLAKSTDIETNQTDGSQKTQIVDGDGDVAEVIDSINSLKVTNYDSNNREGVRLIDDYGFEAEFTPMDEMRVATPSRLVGSNFTGTTVDSKFWTTAITSTGTVTQGNAQLLLQTGTTANSTAKVTSVRKGRYTGGSSLRYRAVVQLTDGETGTADNVRRWGAYDTNNGAFFELNGTTLRVVTRKTTLDTAVAAVDWNTETFTMDLEAHTYEIYWTNSSVWFVIDGDLRHKASFPDATWADTMTLSIQAENNNTNGLDSNIELAIRVQTIYRLGDLETQPISTYQSGTTAGIIMKYGAGNLHGVVISGVVNNSVITLYDNTAASGTVIWSSGTMGAQTQPFDLDFHNLPFSNGLTLVIASANSNITVIYE